MTDVGDENLSIEDVRKDCAVVLSGAEYVRDKILSLASIGPNPLARSSAIYAIKCRVKAEERLLNKVIHRRIVRKDDTYSPYRVKDIVGLRLICIYSDSLLSVTRSFLDFIRFCQTDHVCLFRGTSLDSAIEEVKVYSSDQASYVYDAVHAELHNLGIGMSKIEKVEATRNEPYSSIHIVCRAVSYHASKPRDVPVEVQIRTVFEDAWSEIDHPLRYKGFDYRRIVSNEDADEEVERLYDNAKKNVLALKGTLDSLAIHAEAIRGGFLGLDRAFRQPNVVAGPVVLSGVHFRLKTKSFFSVEPKWSIRNKVERVERLMDRFYSSLSHATASKLPELLLSATEIIEDLREVSKEYEREDEANWRVDADFSYYSQLEHALMYVWRFRLSKMIGGQAVVNSYGDIESAIAVYKRFYQDQANNRDSLIPFRLANAIEATGTTIDLPIDLMEEAEIRLAGDPKERASSILAVSIARQRALFRWIKVQHIRKNKSLFGILAESSKFEVATIREALSASQQADDRLSELASTGAVSEEVIQRELIRSANNFLSYLWEYSVLLGQLDDFALEIVSSGLLTDLIVRVKEGTLNWQNNIGRLDSLVRAHHLLAHPETENLRLLLKTCASEANFLSQVNRDVVEFTLQVVANLQMFDRGKG